MTSIGIAQQRDLPRLRIAIVGDYQIGKSTLVNCLLRKNMAEIGRGKTTTHVNARYSLGHLELIDTPGFGAGVADDETAKEAIDQASVILFVRSSKALDTEIYPHILSLTKGKICLFVLNCINEDSWAPDDEQNEMICKTIEAQLKNHGWDSSFVRLNGRLVTPLNVLWAAFGLRLLHDDRQIKKVRNYLFDDGYAFNAEGEDFYAVALAGSGFQVICDYLDELPLNLLLNAIKDTDKQISLVTELFCERFKNSCVEKESAI